MTTITGEKYAKVYRKYFQPSHLRYADKLNKNYFILDHFIEKSPNHQHVSWQKMLKFRLPEVAPYKRVLFIDGDVYITKHARDAFQAAGNAKWAAVDNNPYLLPYLSENDPKLYDFCPKENRPKIMLNLGVYISTHEIKHLLEKVFYEFKEQNCFDNGPASYYMLNEPGGVVLPTEFNALVLPHRMKFGSGLSQLLRLYRESSFIHLAGGIPKSFPELITIRYIDTHEKSLLTSIIYFFGKPKYDWLTSRVLDLIRRGYGFYRYRFVK